MSLLPLLSLLFAFLASGLPVFLALGVLSLLLFWHDGMSLYSLARLYVEQLNSITIISIPFFIIATVFMLNGGIAQALVNAAYALIGRSRGGLAMVCIISTGLFAAVTGPSVATALAMGTILVPVMLAKNYENPFALGVVSASGTLGILIPPSLAMIVFAIVSGQSVHQLFLAGVVPGLLQAVLIALFVVWYSRKHDYPVGDPMPQDIRGAAVIKALPAIMIPTLTLGGFFSGLLTITEAAGLAAVLAVILSVLFYRSCSLRDIPRLITKSMRTAAGIIFILATALTFRHWLPGSGITEKLVAFIIEEDISAWQFLLFINILMLILGMFLEAIVIILITVPLVLPLLVAMDISVIHYAIVVILNLELALLTPPLGLNLYVLSSISDATVGEVIRGTLPFTLLLFGLLGFVTFFPEISLFLPDLVYGK